MPVSKKTLLLLLPLLAGGVIFILFPKQTPAPAGSGQPAPSSRSSPSQNPLPATLSNIKGDREDAATLAALRSRLIAMPSSEAVALIRSFLASGEDRPTGLDFKISPGGSLEEWPTFRTFLLDTLLAIDPSAAAAIGREILSSPATADEWALSLRNVARGESGSDDDFLREKTEELIRNPAWQADPSVGYLNSFDVLVHTGSVSSTPLLSDLIQNKDRRDLAHASFLTLDRLVQRRPAEMLETLAADSALHASRPEMTAQQFARADLRDPAQQTIVRNWLLDPARTSTELHNFAAVYPNHNRFVSANLLTTELPADGADLAAHDREALEIVLSWREDPAFEPVAEHLGTMLSRLHSFLSPPTD